VIDHDIAFADERQGAARYLQALREHWLLIASLAAIAVFAAAAYSLTAPKRYEASTDVLVSPVQVGDETFIGVNVLREAGVEARSVLTAARLVKTPELAARVKRATGSDLSAQKLLDKVTVTPLEQSGILSIGAEGKTAQAAADLSNAFADQLIAQQTARFQSSLRGVVRRLKAVVASVPPAQRAAGETVAAEQRLAELQPLVGAPDPTVMITSRAVPPEKASWPRPVLSIAVALLSALLLGSGLALALELVSPRVTSEEELLLGQRLPILARVPRMPGAVVRGYLAGREPLPADVREAYRTLRASLANTGPGDTFPSLVLVTSAIPGEGKTMTSVNLATTLALADMRVILVDADLRRPMVATVFGVAGRQRGLASLLTERATADEVLVNAPGHGKELRLALASPEHAHLIDLLEPRRIERVLGELRLHADVVVIDSPPVTEVADALNLADAVDAVVVAVRLGRTRRDRLNELRRLLARRGVPPTGLVVTTRRRPRKGGYYYGASPEEPREAGRRRRRGEPALAQIDADGDEI
jgi:capsular exopolysaccharide synthesis family protein